MTNIGFDDHYPKQFISNELLTCHTTLDASGIPRIAFGKALSLAERVEFLSDLYEGLKASTKLVARCAG